MTMILCFELCTEHGAWREHTQRGPVTSPVENRISFSSLVLRELEDGLRLPNSTFTQAKYHELRGVMRDALQARLILPSGQFLSSLPLSSAAQLGIVVPYAIDPIVCRHLNFLWGNPSNMSTLHKWWILEAPLAVAFLASETLPLPATLLVLTPSPAGAELTAISIPDSRHLEVTAFLELPQVDSVDTEPGSSWLEAICGASSTVSHMIYVDESLSSLAEQVQKTAKLSCPLTPYSLSDLCRGAAIYIQLAEKMRLPIIERIFARDIGILGSGDADKLFWRRLFLRGSKFSQQPEKVFISSQDSSNSVIFAEVAAPDRSPPLWLPQAEWESWRLIVHDVSGRQLPQKLVRSLSVKRRQPKAHWIWDGHELAVITDV